MRRNRILHFDSDIRSHWLSYITNASLCSERYPDTQLMGFNSVLFRKFNIGIDHSAVVVVHTEQRPRSLYIETRVGEESFPHALLLNSNCDKDLV